MPFDTGAPTAVDGAGQGYDTLSDLAPPEVETIEDVHRLLVGATKGAVGVVFAGLSTYPNNKGNWGRAVRLATGENLQARIFPRGRVGIPMGPSEVRMIITKRTCASAPTRVATAIVHTPTDGFVPEMQDASCTSSATIGPRGVQLMLPSLFNEHKASRDSKVYLVELDPRGYHSLRSSTYFITRAPRLLHVSPGSTYLVVAGSMCGVAVPDPMTKAAMATTDQEHSKQLDAMQKKLIKSIGEERAQRYVAAALTTLELITAEGVLGMLTNEDFFDLPDMLRSPIGVPMCIVMAIWIAAHPHRFNLQPGTQQDEFANREMRTLFESRWAPMSQDGFRAIDLVVKAGQDNAKARVAKDSGMSMCMNANLLFWQQLGQRVVSSLMSDPRGEERAAYERALNTPFGRAEYVADPVGDSKYDFLRKQGFAEPPQQAPVGHIQLGTRVETLGTLLNIMDSVEIWLRTGTWNGFSISMPNVNVPARTGDNVASSCDTDFVLDYELCIEAMESGASAVAIAMLHGGYIMHQFGIEVYIAGDGAVNKCADCDNQVDALSSLLVTTKLGECAACNRKRCLACQKAALNVEIGKWPPPSCTRCAQAGGSRSEASSAQRKERKERKERGR